MIEAFEILGCWRREWRKLVVENNFSRVGKKSKLKKHEKALNIKCRKKRIAFELCVLRHDYGIEL